MALTNRLQYIGNYVALQQWRLGETTVVKCHLPESVSDYELVPLLMMLYIGNAFKHRVNPEENAAICVKISLEGSKLQLIVSNNKVTSLPDTEASGIGVAKPG